MPVPPSFLTSVAVVTVIMPLCSVSTVKQVQERTKQQENVRQRAEQMGLMFLPKKKGRDGEKAY